MRLKMKAFIKSKRLGKSRSSSKELNEGSWELMIIVKCAGFFDPVVEWG